MSDEKARDVLAAEEFGVPTPDPRLQRDEAHDVLAAEEFGMPARDPALGHGPVALPDDPTGIVEAHDVLAAEEFAVPAGRGGDAQTSERGGRTRVAGTLAFAGLLAYLLHKRHR